MQPNQRDIPIRSKPNNQSLILQTIYHYGPIKRPDIADLLALTRPTITTAVKTMIEKGIVAEISDLCEPEDTAVTPGRKAYPVGIVGNSKYFIGAEMRRRRRTVCITDYLGKVVYREADRTPCREYEESMDLMGSMICRALDQGPVLREQIAGIGVCLPGLVDSERGVLRIHPGYNWADKNVREDIRDKTAFDGPISVTNNACARTRSVQLFRREPLQGQSFAYMFISSGIACPLMLNDFNSYGSVVGIGEVGHTIMDPNGPQCRCGNRGCLESFSSDSAVIEQCREAMEAGKAPVLQKLCGTEPVTMEKILRAQQQGDPEVRRIVSKAVYILGLGVTNICNFACPGTMFIEGLLFEQEENQKLLQEAIGRNLYSAAHVHTDIVFLKPDVYSGAVGGAAAAVLTDLENYQDRKSRDS